MAKKDGAVSPYNPHKQEGLNLQKHEALSQQVYRRIKEDILNGVYANGKLPPESELAKALFVSRITTKILSSASGAKVPLSHPLRPKYVLQALPFPRMPL